MTTGGLRWGWGLLLVCRGPECPWRGIPLVLHMAGKEHHACFHLRLAATLGHGLAFQSVFILQCLGLSFGLSHTPAQAPAAQALLVALVWLTSHYRY